MMPRRFTETQGRLVMLKLREGEESGHQSGAAVVKLIAPGWGSSGYYSETLLEASAPKFGAGTQMFWNHPTLTEEMERPEGDLRNLSGVLTAAAEYDPEGVEGAGLYAPARIFTPFLETLAEIKDHIGVSIRAFGRAEEGEVDGREGLLITELAEVVSTDFVTRPGAGGKVVELFESAAPTFTGSSGTPTNQQESGTPTNQQETETMELEELREANATLTARIEELTQQNEQMVTNTAEMMEKALAFGRRAMAASMMTESGLPAASQKRVTDQFLATAAIVTADGDWDEDGDQDRLGEMIEAEKAYLAEVVASDGGRIRHMSSDDQDDEELPEVNLEEAFSRLGLSDSAAKRAAQGRTVRL